MLKNILNFEGVTLLNKEEQKTVNGDKINTGCRVLLGSGAGGVINFIGATTGEQVSAAANTWCVNAIANGASSCRYDCFYDGQG